MSIFSSLFTGVSGMRSNERGFGVIGDNIANMNTVGFKGSRAIFADVLNQTVLGSAGVTADLGQGSIIGGIQNVMTQGSLLQTGVTTDLAIGGNGFFILEGSAGGLEGNFYSRNGQFRVDEEGFLTNNSGLYLQGFPADSTGNLNAALGKLQVGSATSPPKPTTEIGLGINLDPNEPLAVDPLTGAVIPFDPANPETTAAFSTSVPMYDSLGNAHDVEIYFVHTASGQWDWFAQIDGGEIEGGTANTPFTITSGSLAYDTDGILDQEIHNVGPPAPVQFLGATSQDLQLDFGDSLTTDLGDGSGSTSYSGGSTVNTVIQNGFGAGSLTHISVDESGRIAGTFSNGDNRILGGLAIALFQGQDALKTVGGNLLAAGPGVSEPIVGEPNNGGRGLIFAGSLEQSNVDLTNEFTQMIVTQRGFQASSRTVTTGNEMLTELVNLIR